MRGERDREIETETETDTEIESESESERERNGYITANGQYWRARMRGNLALVVEGPTVTRRVLAGAMDVIHQQQTRVARLHGVQRLRSGLGGMVRASERETKREKNRSVKSEGEVKEKEK